MPVTSPAAASSRPGAARRFLWPTLGGLGLLLVGVLIGVAASGGGDDGDSTASAGPTVTVTASPAGTKAKAAATVTATVTATAEAADASQSAGASGGGAVDGTQPSRQFPKQAGDWRLDSLSLKDDGLGDFGGIGRITYTGQDDTGGGNVFTITVFDKGGKVLATLQGSATDVKPGQTVTTQLISSDPYRSGEFATTFQKDF